LTCNAQPPGFPVKRFDHPCREIDVDAALLESGTAGRGEVQLARAEMISTRCSQ
jgi:hypothetical protein